RAERAVEAADRAIDHARRADDARREAETMRQRSFWQVWGPTPAEEAARSLVEAVGGPAGAYPLYRCSVIRGQAIVEAWRGNLVEADELADAATALASEYGAEFDLFACKATVARIAMLRGDPATAEREGRAVNRFYRGIGDLGHLSSYAPELADAIYAQGRAGEAMALAGEAESVSIDGATDAECQ